MTQDSSKRGRGRPPKSPAPPGEEPKLTERQWRGLKRELRGCEYLEKWQRDGWPSSTSAQFIADAAGVSREIVYRWRKDPGYAAGLVWLMNERLIHRLDSNGQVDSQSATLDDSNEDEFWVEPDPSLFKRDSEREFETAVEAWLGMVAEALIELSGEEALDQAASRAAEYDQKGKSNEREFWTRLAQAIQEALDQRSGTVK